MYLVHVLCHFSVLSYWMMFFFFLFIDLNEVFVINYFYVIFHNRIVKALSVFGIYHIYSNKHPRSAALHKSSN